jgi:hypothetical protein
MQRKILDRKGLWQLKPIVNKLLQWVEKLVQTRANSCTTPIWRYQKCGLALRIVRGYCIPIARRGRGGLRVGWRPRFNCWTFALIGG